MSDTVPAAGRPRAAAPVSDAPLTPEEIAEIRVKARADAQAKIAKENRKKQMLAIAEEEERKARFEAGIVTGDSTKDEEVSILINVPEHMRVMLVDGVIYTNGVRYNVARHMADSMNDTMDRLRRLQAANKGETGVEYYRSAAPLEVTPTGAAYSADKALSEAIRVS